VRSDLRDIWAIDDNRAVAVGEGGAVIWTENGGRKWVQGEIKGLPPEANQHLPNLSAVFFRDAQVGWAVGSDGVVIRTRAGGREWDQGSDTLSGNLTDIYFSDARTGWITSDAGFIYSSTDGGTNWVRGQRVPQAVRAIHAIADRAWAVGDGGMILRWDSSSWKSVPSPVSVSLNDVLFLNADSGWAAGNDGTVLHTADAGVTWQVVPAVEKAGDLLALARAPRGRVWAVGVGGTVLRYRPVAP